MKLDAALAIDAAHLRDVAGIVRAAEDIGFGALWAPETQHNGFYPLVLAAEHSQRIELGTAVAIAFPRSPMVMAQNAWDLQALSRGRFILGLGTQVKAHIERRYSTPWPSPPGPRSTRRRATRRVAQVFGPDPTITRSRGSPWR